MSIPNDHILWEAERQISKRLLPADFQRAVMSAKAWLILSPSAKLEFVACDGVIQASLTRMDGETGSIEPLDIHAALVFILRAYRLQQGLTEQGRSA